MKFSLAMVYYAVKGLEQIHSFGFSHSDLKMGNICARVGSDGKLKFTLIDFGVVTRLTNIGQQVDMDKKLFRGNLMTSSLDHILSHRSSVLDDIYSLLCVAFQFVFIKLPWEEKLNKTLAKAKGKLTQQEYQVFYIKMRMKHA